MPALTLVSGSAQAQRPVRPLPKVGGCTLGWFNPGSTCIKSR
ncbi:MAG: hypothetical protein VKM34_03785 [Cyanobacteriota bacterium]|nr:hypothetical protein [Cyanobacteriota bacterium]